MQRRGYKNSFPRVKMESSHHRRKKKRVHPHGGGSEMKILNPEGRLRVNIYEWSDVIPRRS